MSKYNKKTVSEDFLNLQDFWYRKLEEDGFKDIELYKTKKDQYASYQSMATNAESEGVVGLPFPDYVACDLLFDYLTGTVPFIYFHCVSIYAQHSTNLSEIDQKIAEYLSKGLSQRQIYKQYRIDNPKMRPIGLTRINKACQSIRKDMISFNIFDPEGLFYGRDDIPMALLPSNTPRLGGYHPKPVKLPDLSKPPLPKKK